MNTLSKLLLAVDGSYAGLQIARTMIRRGRDFNWEDERVVITGGSRGLGPVIARQLADQDARLAICARSEDDLKIAARELRGKKAEVIDDTCDVREPSQVASFIDRVINQFEGDDVLINVAGIITIGPVESMTVDDFHDSMQTNCFGALHTTMNVLLYMRNLGWGRIVNVASIGGKRAVPHMLPYAASKFALVGLSNDLRAELQCHNIFVTTACPGLMRTGSPRNSIFEGQHRDEYARHGKSISESSNSIMNGMSRVRSTAMRRRWRFQAWC